MTVDVKICGLRSQDTLAAACAGGARFVGFVFFPASPRFLDLEEASALARAATPGVTRVGLVVDATDGELERLIAAVPLDALQLHGAETTARVEEVRRRFRLPVIKAVAVGGERDLERARSYEPVADMLLFDARPPAGASRPGGNAQAFDWRLLRGRTWMKPWILAGGLNAGNVAEAVRLSGADAVDVSSGVEDAPGIKSSAKIRTFLQVARSL
jgi:phosphoribosylanthranilate isomerase